MRIGSNGLRLLKHFEGVRYHAYDDIAGVCTVGCGHALVPHRRCTDADYARYGSERHPKMTVAQVDSILRQDLAYFEREVEKAIGPRRMRTTRRHEFSAMVCLAFNIGVGAFQRSAVLRFHKLRQGWAAGRAFLLWNKATINGELVPVAGLTRRRKAERWLYRNGTYKVNFDG